ncbi:MAG: glutaredoxin [Myxococcales bacterium]|nr:glutaredoxin [Myxococcales bacterium]
MAVDVKIYTTTYCGYCNAAKSLLSQRGVPFAEVDCTNDPDVRKWLIDQTGQRTVPQVFIGGIPVGGFNELSQLDRGGKLQSILAGDASPPSVL